MSETIIAGVKPGLRVLVTAAAAGIGKVIADTFLAHGAKVYVCDIDEKALERTLAAEPRVLGMPVDVAEEAMVDRMFEDLVKRLGGLDVLVNNAGIAGPTARVEDIVPADWRRTLAVNLSSHFYCTRRAVPLLKAVTDGAIINISSVAGRLGFVNRLPYAATKWAIVGMTQSLAKELGPHGIRVNAILPGVVAGPRIERVFAAEAKLSGTTVEAERKASLSKVSLRRMVSAQDVANMALFLASPAGRNISGQALSVCGNVETL